MAQPYVGEIRMFAGNFAPAGWAFCDGQLLPISENDVLYQSIGTTYGGDGEETFALPNMQSRIPIHQGSLDTVPYQPGEMAGTEQETLSTQQIPVHTHAFLATSGAGSDGTPANNLPAASPNMNLFREAAPGIDFSPQAAGVAGGSQPHSNLQPYLCVNFIISLFGLFPSQT